MKKQSKITKDIIKSTLIISAIISFLFFLYAPGTVYFSNINDFSYDFFDFAKVMLPTSIIFWILLTGLLLLIRKISEKLFLVCIGGLTAAFVGAYLEGTFFSSFMPVITGSKINWEDYSSHRWISLVLWGGAIAAFLLLFRKNGKQHFLKIVTFIGTLGMVFLLLSFALSGFSDGYINKTDYVPTINHIYECSNEENFIVLLLDSIDGNTYYNLSKNHPEYEEEFKDFTFFRNTMGVYPATQYSIPFILSGEWYENQISFKEYRSRSYEQSILLNDLQNKSWEISMYEPDIPQTSNAVKNYNNVVQSSSFDDIIAFIKMQLMIGGIKYLPFDLKQFCELKPEDIIIDSIKTSNYETFTGNNKVFYDGLIKTGLTAVNGKKFIFIHLEGAHAPFKYDMNMKTSADATYNSSVEASITIAEKYLSELKNAGTYDNSIIIIMADHGSNQEDSSFGRQNPLLMIKGIGENHVYSVSEAPVSYTDLEEAYFHLLDGATAQSAFNWNEGSARERRYLFYFVGEGDTVLKEMIQYGNAWDESSMALTGKQY